MCSSQLPRSGAWPQTQLALTQALAQLAVDLTLTLYGHHVIRAALLHPHTEIPQDCLPSSQNCSSSSRDPQHLVLQVKPEIRGPHPSQVALVVKNLPAKAGDMRDAGCIPGLGRSLRGGNGTPLQSSYLENPMDRGAWRAMDHGVAKSQTRLK